MDHRLIRALAAIPLVLLAACNNGQPGQTTQAPNGKKAQTEVFRITNVGLPSVTLGCIGQSDNAVAGAGNTSKVFYAVKGARNYEVYCTDLSNMERTQITTMDNMLATSLVSDPDGQRLVYSRGRDISSYLDDPAIKEPARVSVVYSWDVAKKQETALFDFREGNWLRYRNAALTPKMSQSGKRVAALTFDVDADNLMRDLDEWLGLAPEYFKPASKLPKNKHQEDGDRMLEILNAPHVAPLLKGAGLAVGPDHKLSPSDTPIVEKVRAQYTAPKWAVAVSDAGSEPKLIELQVPPPYQYNPLTLLAVGDHTLLLGTSGKSTTGVPEVQLLRVDESTGKLTEFSSYLGVPSSEELDPAEQNLELTYLKFDQQTKQVSNSLTLQTIPLDNPAGAKEETLYSDVPVSFAEGKDAHTYAVQSAADNAIYVVAPGAQAVRVLEKLAPVDGMYLSNDSKHLVYAENGFLYSVDLVSNPQQSKDWVAASTFSQYNTEASAFLTKLGYQLPKGYSSRWQETNGLGLHQVTGLLIGPSEQVGNGVLLRYDVDNKQFESLFFPGKPWPNSNLKPAQVDAAESESRAGLMRKVAGWLGATAQKYQPGANALFDGNTQSYVYVFRDGYLVDTPKGKKEAVNGEATIRVHKPTGQVLEMDLTSMPKIDKADFKATDEQVAFTIRNKGNEKYPQQAPIRIDTKNAGLIVARKKVTRYAPAQVEIPTDWRLCWSVDMFIQPENELILTSWVDVENADLLGQLNFLPTNQSINSQI